MDGHKYSIGQRFEDGDNERLVIILSPIPNNITHAGVPILNNRYLVEVRYHLNKQVRYLMAQESYLTKYCRGADLNG